jgi:hypothetical protein
MPVRTIQLPSLEYLNECFLYDEENGVLFWKERPSHHFATYNAYKVWNANYAGKKAGVISKKRRYIEITIKSIHYFVHRIIFKMFYGYDPEYVDHINGIGTDNRPSNLRSVPFKENAKNRKLRKTNKTGISGIVITKHNTFQVLLLNDDGTESRKIYKTLEEASYHRKVWEKENNYHENHGRINNENQT